MQKLSELKKGDNLHHFNIIEESDVEEINYACEKVLNFTTQANPNYFYKKYDTFLVDDAREITQLQSRKHKKGELAFFVLECGSINIPAQNALLKIFEEAHTGTYYFLLLPQSNILLPTFLSRAIVYKGDGKASSTNRNSTKKIFEFPNYDELKKMQIKDRMDLVTKWLDGYKKEKISKSDMKAFVNSLMNELHQKALNEKTELIKNLKKIEDVSNYFDINGAHLKSILEFIVLTI
jgi:hypothetical protein